MAHRTTYSGAFRNGSQTWHFETDSLEVALLAAEVPPVAQQTARKALAEYGAMTWGWWTVRNTTADHTEGQGS